MYVQEIYLVDADVRNYLCAEKFLEIHQGISLLLNEKQVNFSSHRFPKRSGQNMDILVQGQGSLRGKYMDLQPRRGHLTHTV